MKNILKIILILLFVNCKAQTQTVVNINTYNSGNNSNKYFKDINNNYANFVGTWENTTGNITFRLIIWEETKNVLANEVNSSMDELKGSYKIIQNEGTSSEVILYNSVKYFSQSNYTTTWSLLGDAMNSTIAGGYFEDTCANAGTGILSGEFKIEIINLGTTPIQANWLIKSSRNLFPGESFTVPTDAVLTKVN